MIHLYPNSVGDMLTIESDDIITEMVVLNTNGNEFPVIFKKQSERSLMLDISGLQTGTYLAGISTDKTWIMKKFTITR